MRSLYLAAAAAMLIGAAPAKKPLTPGDVVAAAPASSWKTIAADDLLVMDLRRGGRIVIQLAPAFAPVHVGNVKALARGNYWAGATIYRLQDNYVAQWGLNDSDRPWPKGVVAKPPAEYTRALAGLAVKPLGYQTITHQERGSPTAGRSPTAASRAGRTLPIAMAAWASAATLRRTPGPAASFMR